uniref:Uncharacterized protein n=1 Tax=Helianthus annuus TaxID=4232 RepID=A0A251SVD8_HELAN
MIVAYIRLAIVQAGGFQIIFMLLRILHFVRKSTLKMKELQAHCILYRFYPMRNQRARQPYIISFGLQI